MSFPDLFSEGSREYARHRPSYPEALFEAIAERSPSRELVWDCGTGSGQAAQGLAAHFRRVIATDGSAAQLAHAARRANIDYVCAVAERRVLREQSANCITVAQALHWIDRRRFYEIVREVARPGALVAFWTYSLTHIDPAIDAEVTALHARLHAGGYWAPERALVDDHYRSLDFPFDEIVFPAMDMVADWRVEDLAEYIATWSAVRALVKSEGEEPFAAWVGRLRNAWGSAERRIVRWPLAVRAGYAT